MTHLLYEWARITTKGNEALGMSAEHSLDESGLGPQTIRQDVVHSAQPAEWESEFPSKISGITCTHVSSTT